MTRPLVCIKVPYRRKNAFLSAWAGSVLREGKAAAKSHLKLPGQSFNRPTPAVWQAQKATQGTY